MRIRVSADGYTVTGNKKLRSFGIGVAMLDEGKGDKNRWVILLNRDERLTQVLGDIEKTKPRISLFHDMLYVVVEGVDEEFHYYYELCDDLQASNQIKNTLKTNFAVCEQENSSIEKIIECYTIV